MYLNLSESSISFAWFTNFSIWYGMFKIVSQVWLMFYDKTSYTLFWSIFKSVPVPTLLLKRIIEKFSTISSLRLYIVSSLVSLLTLCQFHLQCLDDFAITERMLFQISVGVMSFFVQSFHFSVLLTLILCTSPRVGYTLSQVADLIIAVLS